MSRSPRFYHKIARWLRCRPSFSRQRPGSQEQHSRARHSCTVPVRTVIMIVMMIMMLVMMLMFQQHTAATPRVCRGTRAQLHSLPQGGACCYKLLPVFINHCCYICILAVD